MSNEESKKQNEQNLQQNKHKNKEYLMHIIIDIAPFFIVIFSTICFNLSVMEIIKDELFLSGNILWLSCVYMGNMNYGLLIKVKDAPKDLKIWNWSLVGIALVLYTIFKVGDLLKKDINYIVCYIATSIVFLLSVIIYCIYIRYEIKESKNVEHS